MLEDMIGFALGFCAFLQGLLQLIRTKYLLRHSTLIKGTIIELKQDTLGTGVNSVQTFIPIIEYEDMISGTFKTTESNAGYMKGKYAVGDVVELRYYKNGTQPELLMNNWFAKWGAITAFITVGLFFMIFSGFHLLNPH